MAVFYFTETKQDNISIYEPIKVYELSCTTGISISSPAVVTKSPVEDGSSMIDHFYLDNKTATFTGIITDIRVSGFDVQNTPVYQWIGEIKSLRSSKKLVTLFADTEVIPNCLITAFDLDKTVEDGLSGWKCNLSFQEVDISERAKLVEIKEPKPEVKDDVGEESKGSSNSVKKVGDELETSFWADAKPTVSSLWSAIGGDTVLTSLSNSLTTRN